MRARCVPKWFILLLVALTAAATSAGGTAPAPGGGTAPDRFKLVRAYIQDWLSAATTDSVLISATALKGTIVDDWEHQQDRVQIVSVRKPEDYRNAGHIPHAVNAFWPEIASDESLGRMAPGKTLIHYCYFGHSSMISSTILNLLGHKSRSLNFGMMGWNLEALVKPPWDREADYGVETTTNRPRERFAPPVLASQESDPRKILKEAARAYLSGEGSPVIVPSDLKAILDDWIHKRSAYQIVDVRSKREYNAGHVPHALHIPWKELARLKNLRRLDPQKTVIFYSENGQTGQLAATVLNLLGYKAVAMKFGMMDWNRRCVDPADLWTGAAGYPVERSPGAAETP